MFISFPLLLIRSGFFMKSFIFSSSFLMSLFSPHLTSPHHDQTFTLYLHLIIFTSSSSSFHSDYHFLIFTSVTQKSFEINIRKQFPNKTSLILLRSKISHDKSQFPFLHILHPSFSFLSPVIENTSSSPPFPFS